MHCGQICSDEFVEFEMRHVLFFIRYNLYIYTFYFKLDYDILCSY